MDSPQSHESHPLVSLVPADRPSLLTVVSGAAGNVEGRVLLGNSSTWPDYFAWGNDSYYGYSLINFLDKQHLEVQFIRSDDGAVVDKATLFKKHAF